MDLCVTAQRSIWFDRFFRVAVVTFGLFRFTLKRFPGLCFGTCAWNLNALFSALFILCVMEEVPAAFPSSAGASPYEWSQRFLPLMWAPWRDTAGCALGGPAGGTLHGRASVSERICGVGVASDTELSRLSRGNLPPHTHT